MSIVVEIASTFIRHMHDHGSGKTKELVVIIDKNGHKKGYNSIDSQVYIENAVENTHHYITT